MGGWQLFLPECPPVPRARCNIGRIIRVIILFMNTAPVMPFAHGRPIRLLGVLAWMWCLIEGGACAGMDGACRVVADQRVQEPLSRIVNEYRHRTGSKMVLEYVAAAVLGARIQEGTLRADLVVCMPEDEGTSTPVSRLPGARKVAWKHPSRLPVWVAPVTDHADAAKLAGFSGGPDGHRIWASAEAGFTMVTGKNGAEAFDWVARNRVGHTYPLTAMRMLRELGGIRDGVCIDIGCGPGILAVELAKRSEFRIIGLDIDPAQKPLFEQRIREAGLRGRVSFVLGDARKLPFPDDSADAIVSRGTLTFIPDIGQCLKEVDRVLKPGGVAFLGGRYLYTTAEHKITTDALRRIVAETRLPNATVIDNRGQWVKLVGPEAPAAAGKPSGGPGMLAHRFVADYGVHDGRCLVICGGHGEAQEALIEGFLAVTDMRVTAVYSKEEDARQADEWVRAAKLGERVTCRAGGIEALPFDTETFAVVAGAGPMLIFADRRKAMKEVFRVLVDGGVALVGGQFRGMPAFRRVESETLRREALATGLPGIRIIDEMGQWVEIRKGVGAP